MAEVKVKKVIIPPENLLAVNVADDVNSLTSTYLIRYRIVSEDKTRTSSWSPIYEVQSRTVADMLNGEQPAYEVTTVGDRLDIKWNSPATLKIPVYDVYVQWENASQQPITTAGGTDLYPHVGSFSAGLISIPIPSNLTAAVKYAKVWIQAATFPKKRSLAAKVIETGHISTVYKINGGSIA